MTARERLFCEEYIVDFNCMRAALRAGFSHATARNAAAWIHPEHPTKPQLKAQIDKLIAERSRRTGVSADRVVRELAKVAFANITDVADADGKLLPGAGRDDTAAIAGIRRKSGAGFDEREIRMHDKNRALELLAKHLGILTENLCVEDVRPVVMDDILCRPRPDSDE